MPREDDGRTFGRGVQGAPPPLVNDGGDDREGEAVMTTFDFGEKRGDGWTTSWRQPQENQESTS